MFRALHTSRSGMKAYQDKLDVISNNLANIQTDGYKRIDTDFVSLLKDSIKGQGSDDEGKPLESIPLGTGVRTGDAYRNFDQGILVVDESPLALALEGEGFFGLESETGELLLTRNGYFGISDDGELINGDGILVKLEDSESLEEFLPQQIEVTNSGQLIATGADGKRSEVGKIRLYEALSPESLRDAGNGCFLANKDEVDEIKFGETDKVLVKQGFVEKSNVDMGQEMVDMMISQRAYQMNARAVQSADDMWSLINNMKR